jgi:hypothetical protein
MKRAISLSVLTISMLTILLSAPSVGLCDWIHFEVTCPTAPEGQVLLPADRVINIDDILLSASGETTFSLVFAPPGADAGVTLMKVFFRRIGGLL